MNKNTLIAVYQMGKVRSLTIRRFLEQLDIPNQIYPVHVISPK